MDAFPLGMATDVADGPSFPVAAGAGAGISLCLEQGRLACDGAAVGFSPFEVDLLRLSEHAVDAAAPLLLVPADPLWPAAALIAAGSHIAAMTHARSLTGRAEASPLRVAVVSSDYRTRGLYRSLEARPRRGVGGVPMRRIVPAATLGADNSVNVLDREDGFWSTLFVRSVAEARRLQGLDLVVAELPLQDWRDLAEVKVPVVVVAKDPADPAVARLCPIMPSFAYDGLLADPTQAVTAFAPSVPTASSRRLANRAAADVQVVPVPAPQLCGNAGLFWADIPALLTVGRRSPLASALAAHAFALFHDLLGLAMPLKTYEATTGVDLSGRVGEIARSARLVDSAELRDEWLPMVEAELDGMLATLRLGGTAGTDTAKSDVLRPVVAEALDDHLDVLVVVRTAALAAAYRHYLDEVGFGAARVASIGSLADVAPADLAVLCGMAPTWGRWVYRSGAGSRVRILAYTRGETPLAPMPASHDADAAWEPFDEAATVLRSIARQAHIGRALSTSRWRGAAWRSLRDGSSPPMDTDARRGGGVATPSLSPAPIPPPPEVPPGLWDGAGWSAALEPRPGDAGDRHDDLGRLVPAVRVTFADGSWAWLRAASPVWRWRQHRSHAEQIDAGDVCVGDTLVLVDSDAHKTLLAKVLEVAENVPELAVAGAWHAHWRATLRRAYTSHGSYHALADALAAHGCGVQAQTVRLWCIGVTLGPDDPQDVQRLGVVMGDPVLRDRHHDVARGMQTLRNAHVRLGLRLGRIARTIGAAAAAGRLPADEIIDEASGLTAADVEHAVTLAEVTAIDPAHDVPAGLTGCRRPLSDEEPK